MPHHFPRYCRAILSQILLGCVLLSLAVPLHAAAEAEAVARNFLKFLRSDKVIVASESLQGNLLDQALAPVTLGYLFHLSGGGYLLVSSCRSISPVKAYSLIDDFSGLPEPYRKALLEELELRARVALEDAGRMPLDAGISETAARWDFLLGFEPGRMPLAYVPGTFLLKTRWNQGYPYNKFLPQVGGQTVVAGCVNIAVAQVMRYHGYPASAKGVASYLWDAPPSQVLETILYRSINWTSMPEAVDAATPEFQADEVALLIRDIGIANHTDFDFGGSSTSLNSQALTESFGYSTGLSEKGNGPDQAAFDAFLAALKSEINAERPVLLTFPGHMTVADGYSADESGRKVHVNMGWGGSADDFYFLDEPVQYAENRSFRTDPGWLTIHYNIKPCNEVEGDCTVNLEPGDVADNLVMTGNFNQAGDTDLYDVYLNGTTTIRGTRGYSNVAFNISVLNAADGSEVFALSDPFNAQSNEVFNVGSPVEGVPAGKYIVRISLCNAENTFCYLLGLDHYTVTLTSGTLTTEEKAAADQAVERPPVIGSMLPDLLLKANGGTRRILIDARDQNGDAVTLSVQNSNPAAVGAVLNGKILELTPTGAAKVSSRIAVTAAAKGQVAEKVFTVMTDDVETGFGKSFTIGGTFNDQNDVKIHRVILDGVCTIAGDRSGYSNQAFFSSVLDVSGNVVASADGFDINEISAGFSRGIYRLRGAVCLAGSCYPFTADDTYAFAVSCPEADDDTTTLAGLLGIDLAGANLPFDKPGDVNGDGSVTLADAVLVMRMLSGRGVSAETILTAGDANGDRKIGLAEALFILQGVAGLRESGP
ncbi:MAG: C10 family peptidase [Deltaproteobacteria bacterium]|nr:C10 family peptidase [Deltaproteobacteria bacterium]